VDYSEQRPGLELNDIGRMGSADNRFFSSNVRYRENEPGRLFRGYEVGLYQEQGWNFGGVRNNFAYRMGAWGRLSNFWSVATNLIRIERALSDDLTRGGPLMRTASGWRTETEVGGNPARRTRWEVETGLSRDEQ
jgi:hypothetical protein